jgi:hypothetical protein
MFNIELDLGYFYLLSNWDLLKHAHCNFHELAYRSDVCKQYFMNVTMNFEYIQTSGVFKGGFGV